MTFVRFLCGPSERINKEKSATGHEAMTLSGVGMIGGSRGGKAATEAPHASGFDEPYCAR